MVTQYTALHVCTRTHPLHVHEHKHQWAAQTHTWYMCIYKNSNITSLHVHTCSITSHVHIHNIPVMWAYPENHKDPFWGLLHNGEWQNTCPHSRMYMDHRAHCCLQELDIVTWSTLSLSSLAMSLKMLTSWVQRGSRKLYMYREEVKYRGVGKVKWGEK